MKTQLKRAGLWAVFSVAVLTGCERWAHRDSRQGRELEQILKEDRQVHTEVPQNLPVQFEPVVIERQGRGSGVHYRAVLVWKLVGTRAQAERALRQLGTNGPDSGTRPVQSVRFRIRQVAQGGKLCGYEDVTLSLAESSESVPLQEFGASCTPDRLIAEVLNVTFVEPPAPQAEPKKTSEESPTK